MSKKIEDIKKLREILPGLGLKLAKDLVDASENALLAFETKTMNTIWNETQLTDAEVLKELAHLYSDKHNFFLNQFREYMQQLYPNSRF